MSNKLCYKIGQVKPGYTKVDSSVPVDFSMSGLGLVAFDHDKGPNSSRFILLKHFAPRACGALFTVVSKVKCLN